jgi:hypothetical protein
MIMSIFKMQSDQSNRSTPGKITQKQVKINKISLSVLSVPFAHRQKSTKRESDGIQEN